MTLLKNVAARSLALTVVYALALAIIDRSGTTDPLGAGLLLFLVFVVVSLVWSVLDGRRDASTSLIVWLLTAIVVGVLVTIVSALLYDTITLDPSEFLGTVLLVGVLVFPAALVGTGIGALIGRATRD